MSDIGIDLFNDDILHNHQRKTFDKHIDGLQKVFHDKEMRINYLEKQVKELQDEKFLDTKYKEMHESMKTMEKDLRRGFAISKEDNEHINEWKNKHIREKHWDKNHDCPKSQGAIGGMFSYHFIPTSIGTVGTIKCSCGEKFDFWELS